MLVQLLDGVVARDPLPPPQHALQRGGDGLGPIVGAQLTPRHLTQPLGHVAHGDRHHRQIAGERLLHDVGRPFLHRREHQCVARAHEAGDVAVGDSPGDDQLRRERTVEDVERRARQGETLARQRGVAGEQHQSLVERHAEAEPRLVPGHGAEEPQVQAGRNHARRHGWMDQLFHVFRHDDRGIGASGDCLARELEQPAAQREPPARILDALQVVSPERDDERQALGECQQSALPELCMNQVVPPAPHPALDAEPGLDVVPEPARSLEVEHVDVHTGRLQELRLTLDEVRGARATVGHRPLARDHEHPNRGGGHQGWPSAAGLGLSAPLILQLTTCARAARAAAGSSLRSLTPPRTQGNTSPYAVQRSRR